MRMLMPVGVCACPELAERASIKEFASSQLWTAARNATNTNRYRGAVAVRGVRSFLGRSHSRPILVRAIQLITILCCSNRSDGEQCHSECDETAHVAALYVYV